MVLTCQIFTTCEPCSIYIIQYTLYNVPYTMHIIQYIVNEGKKRTSKLSGKKTHPVLTEKLTLDRANIKFL